MVPMAEFSITMNILSCITIPWLSSVPAPCLPSQRPLRLPVIPIKVLIKILKKWQTRNITTNPTITFAIASSSWLLCMSVFRLVIPDLFICSLWALKILSVWKHKKISKNQGITQNQL